MTEEIFAKVSSLLLYRIYKAIVVFKMPCLEGARVWKIVCDFGLNKVMSHKLCSLSKISTMIGI
jgi:hypothetical protein